MVQRLREQYDAHAPRVERRCVDLTLPKLDIVHVAPSPRTEAAQLRPGTNRRPSASPVSLWMAACCRRWRSTSLRRRSSSRTTGSRRDCSNHTCNSEQTGTNRGSCSTGTARRNVNPPARSSITRPASRSRPRCLDIPDWAICSTAVNSLTLSRSLVSSHNRRSRASSPKRRNRLLASFIFYKSIYRFIEIKRGRNFDPDRKGC